MSDNKYPPYKVKNSGYDIYGKPRLELALHLKSILNSLDITWFIENGTLLGAYRNSKFIKHDDDFDIAILYKENVNLNLKKDLNLIKNKLDEQYGIRLVDSYASKIEVFNPKFGKYKLIKEYYNDADYHHVTVDLQAYILKDNKYKCLHNNSNSEQDKNNIFPLGKISLENNIFPCPKDPKKFLENTYGSIDPNAKYNKITKKYELK